MGLFGNREEKAAKEAGAQAETDRLLALPAGEFAAEVMQALGPGGLETASGHRQGPLEIAGWLISGFSGSVKYKQPLLGPTIEALGMLESANLVGRRSFGTQGNASTYHATPLGEEALADGSIPTRLSAPAAD